MGLDETNGALCTANIIQRLLMFFVACQTRRTIRSLHEESVVSN